MIDKLKDNIIGLVIATTVAIMIILLGFTKDNIIEAYIVPIAVDKLKEKGYINDNKDKPELIKNKIDAISGKISKISKTQQQTEEKITPYEIRIFNLEKGYKVLQEERALDKVKINELVQIIDAKSQNQLEVKLFVSEKSIDSGFLILNLNNNAIKHLIKNGQDYEVCSIDGECIELESRVEPAVDLKSDSHSEAIGRVYFDDYHKIFNGSRSGSRKAVVKLKNEQ